MDNLPLISICISNTFVAIEMCDFIEMSQLLTTMTGVVCLRAIYLGDCLFVLFDAISSKPVYIEGKKKPYA